MTPVTLRAAGAFAALATAVALSACSSSPSAQEPAAPSSSTMSLQPAGDNADDIAFATNMIPHLKQAIELAALVPDRTSNPDVIAMASQIADAQQTEMQTLQVFLVQWKEGSGTAPGLEGHGNTVPGMVDQATIAQLESLSGADFDTLWLQTMIEHHQGAIEMANAEIANGENVDAIGLARTIVTTRQAEIDQMNTLLEGG